MTRYIHIAEHLIAGWPKWVVAFGFAALPNLAALVDDVPLYIVVIVFVGIDSYTGWKAAKKKGEASSRDFRRFVPKLIEYILLLFALSLFAWSLEGQAVWGWTATFVRNAVFVAVVLTELKSWGENVGANTKDIIKWALDRWTKEVK